MAFFIWWTLQHSWLVTGMDRSCYIFFVCQPTKCHLQFSHSPLPGTRDRTANPSIMREGWKEVASNSLCCPPSPPTAAKERHKKMGKLEKWLLTSTYWRRIGMHRCTCIYFGLVWLLLEMVQSPGWVCRAVILGKIKPYPILLLNWPGVL